jgi:hypothetical protein
LRHHFASRRGLSRIHRRLDLSASLSDTGVNLAEEFRAKANRFGGTPFHLTTDKGANMRLGARLFLGKDGAPFVLNDHLSSGIPCFAHGLDNMLKDAFKIPAIALLYQKQTKSVKFFRKSNNANRLLRDKQAELRRWKSFRVTTWAGRFILSPANSFRCIPDAIGVLIAGKTRCGASSQNKRFVRPQPALVRPARADR